MELKVYSTIGGLLKSLGKNDGDRNLFARMKNRGEVFEIRVVSEEKEENYYVKEKDIEEVYIMSLAEGIERMRRCLEEMRKKYIEKGSGKEEKKEKNLYDDSRESKIGVAEDWKGDN